MARPPPPTPTDPDVSFPEAVGPVRPLKVTHTLVPATPPNPLHKRRRSTRGDLAERASANPKDAFIQSGDELSFRRASVPAQLLHQLRRGQFLIEADIDLHGLSAQAAEATLRRYLHSSLTAGHRCVRVVHGKGVLRWQVVNGLGDARNLVDYKAALAAL